MNRLCPLLLAVLVACNPTSDADSGRTDRSVEHIDGWGDESLDLYFNDGSLAGEDRLAAELMAAETRIRVAMYNLRSERLGWLLLDRQNAGVEVEVLWDKKQMEKPWNTLDDELAAAGLNIVPVLNQNTSYATLHDKLAVIDGHRVTMGSANWSQSGLIDNEETTMVFESPALAAVVSDELDQIAAGNKVSNGGTGSDHAQLYFSPEDRLDLVIRDAIDGAQERIYVAVFSLRLDSLIDALIDARGRGVEVFVITDHKQSSTTDADERLRDAGVTLIEALNETTPFTAMHHKFAVIDSHTTLAGSYNWSWTATFGSYEDLAVIANDAEVAAAFEGEFGRVWRRYADAAGAPDTQTIEVEIEAYRDNTNWGDSLVLVGDIPELGGWDPNQGVQLAGDNWPTWNGTVQLPGGADIEYKLVLLRADGHVEWESGVNHTATLRTDVNEPTLVLRHAFRY